MTSSPEPRFETWKSVREQVLSNPEVKKYYDELTPEFEKARHRLLRDKKKIKKDRRKK